MIIQNIIPQMNRRIVDCIEEAQKISCKYFKKHSSAVHKGRKPWSLAKQRLRHTICRGKREPAG